MDQVATAPAHHKHVKIKGIQQAISAPGFKPTTNNTNKDLVHRPHQPLQAYSPSSIPFEAQTRIIEGLPTPAVLNKTCVISEIMPCYVLMNASTIVLSFNHHFGVQTFVSKAKGPVCIRGKTTVRRKRVPHRQHLPGIGMRKSMRKPNLRCQGHPRWHGQLFNKRMEHPSTAKVLQRQGRPSLMKCKGSGANYKGKGTLAHAPPYGKPKQQVFWQEEYQPSKVDRHKDFRWNFIPPAAPRVGGLWAFSVNSMSRLRESSVRSQSHPRWHWQLFGKQTTRLSNAKFRQRQDSLLLKHHR